MSVIRATLIRTFLVQDPDSREGVELAAYKDSVSGSSLLSTPRLSTRSVSSCRGSTTPAPCNWTRTMNWTGTTSIAGYPSRSGPPK